jgi:hypothetical protein
MDTSRLSRGNRADENHLGDTPRRRLRSHDSGGSSTVDAVAFGQVDLKFPEIRLGIHQRHFGQNIVIWINEVKNHSVADIEPAALIHVHNSHRIKFYT